MGVVCMGHVLVCLRLRTGMDFCVCPCPLSPSIHLFLTVRAVAILSRPRQQRQIGVKPFSPPKPRLSFTGGERVSGGKDGRGSSAGEGRGNAPRSRSQRASARYARVRSLSITHSLSRSLLPRFYAPSLYACICLSPTISLSPLTLHLSRPQRTRCVPSSRRSLLTRFQII